MNWRMYLSFLKWCFMKIFGSVFDGAETFRKQLKKGAPDSIFACFAFIAITGLSFIVFAILVLWLVGTDATGKYLVEGYFFAVIFSFIYNIVKAAFECFKVEYEEPFEILKNRD